MQKCMRFSSNPPEMGGSNAKVQSILAQKTNFYKMGSNQLHFCMRAALERGISGKSNALLPLGPLRKQGFANKLVDDSGNNVSMMASIDLRKRQI